MGNKMFLSRLQILGAVFYDKQDISAVANFARAAMPWKMAGFPIWVGVEIFIWGRQVQPACTSQAQQISSSEVGVWLRSVWDAHPGMLPLLRASSSAEISCTGYMLKPGHLGPRLIPWQVFLVFFFFMSGLLTGNYLEKSLWNLEQILAVLLHVLLLTG